MGQDNKKLQSSSGNGRTAAREILNTLAGENVSILFIKDEFSFRSYDASAEQLCDLFDIKGQYQNKAGHIGIQITSNDFVAIKALLDEAKVSYAIKDGRTLELHLFDTSTHSILFNNIRSKSADFDTRVYLKDHTNNDTLNLYLARNPITITRTISTDRGLQEIEAQRSGFDLVRRSSGMDAL